MQKTNSKMKLKTCAICGRRYSVLTSRRIKYCSEACARISREDKKRKMKAIHAVAERIRMKHRLKKADEEYAKKFPKSASRTRVKHIQMDAANITASICRYF